MRIYEELEVDTIEEADMFLPGMHVLVGDTDEEWTVETIVERSQRRSGNRADAADQVIHESTADFLIRLYRDVD